MSMTQWQDAALQMQQSLRRLWAEMAGLGLEQVQHTSPLLRRGKETSPISLNKANVSSARRKHVTYALPALTQTLLRK